MWHPRVCNPRKTGPAVVWHVACEEGGVSMSVIENFLVPERLESREPSASRMTRSMAAADVQRS